MLKETHFQIKGMSQDLAYQVFNSQYAFECKNIRINTTDKNSLLSISNEKGNTEVATIEYKGDAVTIIGVGQFSEYCVLFGTTGEEDVILLVRQVEQDGEIIEQVEQVYPNNHNNANLGFSKEHPIKTVCVYENEQMQKVYWIDGINPPRVLNIAGHLNKDLKIKTIGEQKIDFLPKLKFEEKVTISKTSGGLFPAGVIQYAFTYSDKGLQESNLWYVSPLYYITQTNKGAEAGTSCNVAFKLDFSGIDTSFNYMQIYAIIRTSLNATPACYRIANIPTTTTTFTDTGSQWEACSADVILGKQLGTFLPKTIASKDSTLFLGNYTLESPLVKRENYESFITEIANNTDIVFPDVLPNTEMSIENGANSLQTFRSGEHYRIGIQFQDEYGTPSNVIYLKDIENVNIANPNNAEFSQKVVTSILPSIPSDFKYKRARLMMVDRTNLPHRTLCQGVLCPTVYRINDRVNNSPFAMNSWCMRGFEKAANTERPTWRPDTPLKANSNIGGAEIENQVEVDSNQILVDISTENTQYYLMHVRVYRNKAAALGVTSVGFHSELYTTTDSSVTTIDKATKIYSYSFFFGEVGYTEIPSNAELKSNLIAEAVRTLDKEGVRYPERVAYNLFKEWNAIDFYTEFQTNTSLVQINLLGTSSAPIITSDAQAVSFNAAAALAKERGQSFFCDHNILTFHSPDVERYQNIIDNNSKLKYRIVGYTNIEESHFDYYIQHNTPESKSESSGIQTVEKLSIAGIYNASIWKDDKLYQVYIWNKYTTLGSQSEAKEGKWYGSYTKKVMANTHKCGASSAFTKNGNPLALFPTSKLDSMQTTNPYFPEMGTPRVFNFDEITALQLDDQPYSRNIHNKLIYYGNVNIAHIDSTYKAQVFSASENKLIPDGDMLSDFCNISYKSSPHIVMPMSYFSYTYPEEAQYTEYLSPSLPYPYRGVATEHAKTKGYIWSKAPHGFAKSNLSGQDSTTVDDFKAEENQYCLLYIAELYQDLDVESIYGNTDESTLSKHIWVPISDWVNVEQNKKMVGYGDAFIGRWECLKSYAYNEDSQQSYIDITSFVVESDSNLESRYDNYRNLHSAVSVDASKFNLFNPVYNQQNNLFSYRAFTKDESINNFQNQICWSEVKTLGEELDTWCQINVGNNTDLQGEYGKLNGMITSNNSLYCFQDNAVYKINYNTRVTISPSDGVPIQLTNNYRMDPPLLLRTDCGIQHQDCLSKSSNNIYFFDGRRNRIFTMGKDDNIIDLSGAKGVNSLLGNLGSIKNVLYDSNIKDIYFNFYNTSLCYNEDIAEFTSLYDYHHASNIFCLGANTYLLKDNGIYKQRDGEYSTFFGQKRPYYIEILANDNPLISKTFTNVEFNMDPTYLGSSEEIFDFIYATTSYQEGCEDLKVNKIKPSNMKRKFRIWRINLPREEGTMNRLRDRWCRIQLHNTNPSGNNMRLNYINVSYIPD